MSRSGGTDTTRSRNDTAPARSPLKSTPGSSLGSRVVATSMSTVDAPGGAADTGRSAPSLPAQAVIANSGRANAAERTAAKSQTDCRARIGGSESDEKDKGHRRGDPFFGADAVELLDTPFHNRRDVQHQSADRRARGNISAPCRSTVFRYRQGDIARGWDRTLRGSAPDAQNDVDIGGPHHPVENALTMITLDKSKPVCSIFC